MATFNMLCTNEEKKVFSGKVISFVYCSRPNKTNAFNRSNNRDYSNTYEHISELPSNISALNMAIN